MVSRHYRIDQRIANVASFPQLIRGGRNMAGRSPVAASVEQRAQLLELARSDDRGEADRARAILLTLEGWTSQRIAEVYLVRQDTVRFWRGDFLRGGVEALKASIAPGLPPVKTEAALRVVAPLLEAPVADRPNWTIPRLIEEVKRVERVTVSRSTMSKALRKKTSGSGDRGTR